VRSVLLWLLLILVGATLVALADRFCCYALGVGHFDQSVELRSEKTIARVSYSNYGLDEEMRRHAESSADERMFSWQEPAAIVDDSFTARIMFTNKWGLFHYSEGFQPHLVVLVDFVDGTRACRVVDLPKQRGKEKIAVDFRRP
jgi:hypothetical protein